MVRPSVFRVSAERGDEIYVRPSMGNLEHNERTPYARLRRAHLNARSGHYRLHVCGARVWYLQTDQSVDIVERLFGTCTICTSTYK